MVNWEPDRASQKLFEPLRRRRPLPPPSSDQADWGRPEVLDRWLTAGLNHLVFEPQPFAWDFPSAQQAADFFLSASPLHVSALATLPPDEQSVVRSEMEAMLGGSPAGGQLSLPSPYLLVTAVRATA